MCFGIADKLAGGFTELPLRRAEINLYNRFAAESADVFYNRRNLNSVVYNFGAVLIAEICVRQAVAERVHNAFLCKRFKISVPYINILGIYVFYRVSVIFKRRIIIYIIRYCVCKPARWGYIAKYYVRKGIAALLPALPSIKHARHAILFHPFHIHNITDIQHYANLFKVP